MSLPLPGLLGLGLFVSELGLRLDRKSDPGSARQLDRSSLFILWLTILFAVFAAFLVPRFFPAAGFELSAPGTALCLLLFAGGLALRWWAVLTLGRLFTVDVAIHADHRLITVGVYRVIRHPSYTGLLLAFLGLGLALEHWLSLACLLVPTTWALLHRIRVEEEALLAAFGEEYRTYRAHTRSLIPGVF